MVGSRRQKMTKHNRYHVHMGRILFVIAVALTCAVRADETEVEDSCSMRVNCEMCTSAKGDVKEYEYEGYEESCWWSLDRQECLEPMSSAELYPDTVEALVHETVDCPRLQVVGDGRAFAGQPFVYTVNVTNDAMAGLVPFARRYGVACLTGDGVWLAGRAETNNVGDGGHIACDPVTREPTAASGHGPWSMSVVHYYVVIGPYNASLRLDHEMDYYVSFYDRDCSTVGDEGDGGYVNGCVDCSWTANDYRYYAKRCSTRNQCVGPFEYYDRRYVYGTDEHVTSWERGVRTECGPAITVESFEPESVPWSTTAVNVTVTIRNHRVLAEGATVNVTVAGRACENVQTSAEDADTVNCTVTVDESAIKAAEGPAGPVRVTYSAGHELAVESQHPFRFVAPNVTGMAGPPCGPSGGGTTITVLGTGFDKSREAHVFIEWSDGVQAPCPVSEWFEDHLQCVTEAWFEPTGRGRVRVDFDRSARLYVPKRGFAFVDSPRSLTDGPRLTGIASGGTEVPARWHGADCLRDGPLVIFTVYPHNERRKCDVRDADSVLVCQSPRFEDLVSGETERRFRAAMDGRPDPGPRSDAPLAVLRCDFTVRYAGDVTHYACPDGGYAVYADPSFEDFEVDADGRVVIYGHGELGLGWDETDATVWVPGWHGGGHLRIERLGRDRMVCAADPETAAWLSAEGYGRREVRVSVGHAAVVTVPRRSRVVAAAASADDDRTFADFVADHVLAAGSMAVLMTVAAVGSVFLLRWWKKRAAALTRDDTVRLHDLHADDIDDITIFTSEQ